MEECIDIYDVSKLTAQAAYFNKTCAIDVAMASR